MLRVVNDILQAKGLMMRTGTAVDATHDRSAELDQERRESATPRCIRPRRAMHWYFGMKAHIGVDAESGLVHTVVGTAANVNDSTSPARCCTVRKTAAFGDAGYQGVAQASEEAAGPTVARGDAPGKRKKLNPFLEP
jgi:IS5 family transposase